MSSQPTTLGQYQIIREIARSNDIVYEGYDPLMNRRVAVKELSMPAGHSPQQLEDRVSRFRREAQAVGSLNHPNIMTVFSFSEDQGRYFMAMEFLDGITLRKEIDNNGFLPVDRAIEIAVDVLSGLANAHDAGVVHRDIKPDNIQLTTQNGVKITDFGIARLTFQPNLTMDGQVFGTPSYMSPEQIVGKDIDQRTDLFSVGVMLYEMISGSKPFTGDNVIAITHAVVNSRPNKPSQMPDWLWPVVERAMEKAPQMRHYNANEMRNAILDAKTMSMPGVPPVQNFDPYATPPASLINQPITPYGTPNPYLNAPPIQTQSYLPPGSTSYGGVMPGTYNPYGTASPPPQAPPVTYSNYSPYMPGTPTSNQQMYQPPPGVYYPPPPGRPLMSPEAKQRLKQVVTALLIAIIAVIVLIVALTSMFNSIERGERIGSNRTPQPAGRQVPTPASSSAAGNINPGPSSSVNPSIEPNSENTYQGPDPDTLIRQAESASTPESKTRLLVEAGDALQKLGNSKRAFETYYSAYGALLATSPAKSELRVILYKMEEVTTPGSQERASVDVLRNGL
jgi:eukaryotic-like serine/threonine-protein kinase